MNNLNKESILNQADAGSGFLDGDTTFIIGCDGGSKIIEGWGGDIKSAKPDN